MKRNLPQFIESEEVIYEVLSLFTVLEEPGHKVIGYNSAGGFASVNHLHFHIFDPRYIYPDEKKENSKLYKDLVLEYEAFK